MSGSSMESSAALETSKTSEAVLPTAEESTDATDETITATTAEDMDITQQSSAQYPRDNCSVNRKTTASTLKEENDKLRTYLGLVKMCNNSAINKIKTAITDTIEAINMANESPIDSEVIIKQLSVIDSEIMNMQSIHTQLDEGIETVHIIDNKMLAEDHSNGHNKEPVIVMTTRHDVPRKSTGIRKSKTTKSSNKAKSAKAALINTKLLNRVVDNTAVRTVVTAFVDQSTNQVLNVVSEEQSAVANIDHSSGEERENVLREVKGEFGPKVTKRPYISEEFKSSHLQRLVEAKRRREEMNRQLERDGKRKGKSKRFDDQRRDALKTSPKKRSVKKKMVGKATKKKTASPPITSTQSIVVPINQSTLDSLAGQTIQIIASGGTQILCRNDGTFIPTSNSTQWQSNQTQWTTADGTTSFTSNQWQPQYQT